MSKKFAQPSDGIKLIEPAPSAAERALQLMAGGMSREKAIEQAAIEDVALDELLGGSDDELIEENE